MTAGRHRFSLPLIALHWLTLALLVGVYACAELREAFPKGSTGRTVLHNWHVALGLTIFGLVWLRLLVRAFNSSPAIEPAPPRWQALLSTAVHVGLYALMITLPLTGWLMVNADGKSADWFGVKLPMLIGASRPLAHDLHEVHEAISSIGYALIGLHAAAALLHHYVFKDNTLRRMLLRLRA